MRSPLRAIGYWSDTRIGSPIKNGFVSPKRWVGKYETEEIQNLVSSYLDSGSKLVGWLGYSHCRFNCGKPDHEMGSCDLTDGVWVWPEGLSHYVKIHSVVLPIEFIDYMRQSEWIALQIDQKDLQDIEDTYELDCSLCMDRGEEACS